MIEIDGSIGGGQILRTALTMSLLTGEPFHITNIRKSRPKPGVKHQHLIGIEAVKKLSKTKFEGAFLGSEELTCYPGEYKGGNITLDVKTAGSATLVLQSIILPMVFLKQTRVKIIGGTDVPWSPTSDYFKNVLAFYFRNYAEIEVKIVKRGYYPKGGGILIVKTKPYKLNKYKPLNLIEQSNDFYIVGISNSSKELMSEKVSERQADSAKEEIKKKINTTPDIDITYSDSESKGSHLCMWAVFNNFKKETSHIIGADGVSKNYESPEELGRDVGERLVEEIKNGVVDKLLADQLIPLLGVVGGAIKTSEITEHTRANVEVVNKFLKGRKIIIEDECRIIRTVDSTTDNQ